MGALAELAQGWRRRRWRPDAEALAAYAGLKPFTVVTGGSDGIGLALARRFAAAGNNLLLLARRPDPLEAAANAIRAASQVEVATAAVDITAADAVAAIEAALQACGGYADILINSAGIGAAGPFADQSPETLIRLVELNVRALTVLSRHFLPGMRVRGRGGILNLASLGSYTPGPQQAAYYASKAYVLSLSEAVAAETAGEGVRVCALAPGPVATRFHARMGAERAFYRALVPPASADAVARAGYLGFVLGWRVTVPGLLGPPLALGMRVMPHRLLVPIVAWLLHPRG
ncbi:MAG TPA: SDR family NAD(P)-dependent oxidoreductase [Hyphomicrobiaceae bacterium]|nr:SDR family NAD(P)-dependent oxidoreductase [Hyphomicrobiaceae bacterium]